MKTITIEGVFVELLSFDEAGELYLKPEKDPNMFPFYGGGYMYFPDENWLDLTDVDQDKTQAPPQDAANQHKESVGLFVGEKVVHKSMLLREVRAKVITHLLEKECAHTLIEMA